MKLHGVRMDESHANTLLRMCYNRLRQSWVPGGYPPHKAEAAGGAGGASLPGSRRTQERQRLLEVRGWAGNMPNCGLAGKAAGLEAVSVWQAWHVGPAWGGYAQLLSQLLHLLQRVPPDVCAGADATRAACGAA